MKRAICLSFVLSVLLVFNAFAQQDNAASAPSSSAKASDDSSGKNKEKNKGKEGKEKEGKEGKEKEGKEGKEKEGKEKDGDKDKGSSQDGVKLVAPKGDTLKLKNGKVIEGVKIIRTTPREYQIEVTHGGVPINIPHNQVESVTHAENTDSSGGQATDAAGNTITGQKLSPELDKKLSSTDLSHPPLQYKDTDLLKILEELGKKAAVTIVVEQPVKDLDPKERIWSFTAKEGTTLQTLLSTDLPAQFKKLAVQYQFDKIVVTTKDAAAKAAATPPPAGAAPKADAAKPAAADAAKSAPADAAKSAPADATKPAPSPAPAKAPAESKK